MVDRAEAYYLYFRAVQGLENVLNYVDSETGDWSTEIEYFRSEIERITDIVIEMSITEGWSHAFKHGGFEKLWMEYEEFAHKHFRPYFDGGIGYA